ncbi:MAG: signal recognition particle-docking protein FtsY [Candidatus Aureabacteria bacterium]|nr:signal recognition particle-docking protein FtsY [Candidatus Auribacterota bacterium]
MQGFTRSLYDKVKSGLRKTRESLTGRFLRILPPGSGIHEKLEDIEEILIESDLGIELSQKALGFLENSCRGGKGSAQGELMKSLQNFLLSHCLKTSRSIRENPSLSVVVFMGINGTGKTTTLAKTARILLDNGKKVILAACDTFRAAAIEQISLWGEKLGVNVIKSSYGADAASVAFDAIDSAKAKAVDYLLIDTAGRLHSRKELMEELKKILRVCSNKIPPDHIEKFFILDGTAGQNGLTQAKAFYEAVGIDSIVVTKLDGTAKGGVVIAIENQLNVPVKFIGVGEGMDDLIPFDAEVFVEAMLK